jgi:3-methylcrotonyl-CoA carboxylase alpha subunit
MFLPSPGTLSTLSFPEGDGIRVDTGVRQGDAITPHYDSMIAKVIVHAPSRAAAIERMLAALERTEIAGITSNRDFLARVIAHPDFAAGRTLTSFIETHKASLT